MRLDGRHSAEDFEAANLLIVDDEEENCILMTRMLRKAGCNRVEVLSDPSSIVDVCRRIQPDVVLLDYRLQGTDGIAVLRRLWSADGCHDVAVIMLTGNATDEVRKQAFELGVSDFLYKDFDFTELLTRVRNVLHSQRLRQQIERQVQVLESTVRMRTAELEGARREVLDRLAIAAEYRDDQTGQHTIRVGRLSCRIAAALGLPNQYVESIQVAARLHDLGKIGISDLILLKPGKLTDAERAIMQRHPQIGASILADCTEPVLAMAREIALSHHERWDGRGYPRGLAGEEIPLCGRIVAVADTFDAMTSHRPYQAAVSPADAQVEIRAAMGSQFDPAVVQAFLSLSKVEAESSWNFFV